MLSKKVCFVVEYLVIAENKESMSCAMRDINIEYEKLEGINTSFGVNSENINYSLTVREKRKSLKESIISVDKRIFDFVIMQQFSAVSNMLFKQWFMQRKVFSFKSRVFKEFVDVLKRKQAYEKSMSVLLVDQKAFEQDVHEKLVRWFNTMNEVKGENK